MCKLCQNDQGNVHHTDLSRRSFLIKTSVVSASLLASSSILSQTAMAKAPPKANNIISPDEAFERIIAGNKRYSEGLMRRHDFVYEREALVGGQNPYVAVLGCADSRISPEYAFDSARGDVFAVRVAGNFITENGLGSLEYAVAILKTPLIVVLGHESCGAVAAAVKYVQDKTEFPGNIKSLAEAISPAVRKVIAQSNDNIIERSVDQNVKDTIQTLITRSEIIASAINDKKLRIVGGVYRLANGHVDFFT